jgi:arylsulfatase A-like enzyme
MERKGWGPGSLEGSGRENNPAGPAFDSFREFFEAGDRARPFCYWFGSHDPHRPYEKGSGLAAGMNPKDVRVPPHLPDTPEVRSDILDYFFEVQRFDRETGEILQILEKAGQLDITLIVITGDNGMPFRAPRRTCTTTGRTSRWRRAGRRGSRAAARWRTS